MAIAPIHDTLPCPARTLHTCTAHFDVLIGDTCDAMQSELMDYLRSLWKKEEQLRTKQELMMQKELILLKTARKHDKRSKRTTQSPSYRQCGEIGTDTKKEKEAGKSPQVAVHRECLSDLNYLNVRMALSRVCLKW